MKKKILVVSAASPSDTNTGMLSVDLAAFQLLKKFPKCEYYWLTFAGLPTQPSSEFFNKTKGKIKYLHYPIKNKMLRCFDLILIWGDFQLSRTWCRKSALYLHNRQLKKESEKKFIHGILFNKIEKKILKKTIIYGVSNLPDNHEIQNDLDYYLPFQKLIKNVHRVWARDPISAARFAQLRKKDENCMGVDPAWLLKRDKNIRIKNNNKKCKTIGICLGSRTNLFPEVLDAILQIKNKFRFSLKHIPWIQTQKITKKTFIENAKKIIRFLRSRQISRDVLENINKQIKIQKYKGFENCLHEISTCKLIITDLYHLAINAWSLHVPVLFIGENQPNETFECSTLNDEKKLILYYTLHMQDFYFTKHRILNEKNKKYINEIIKFKKLKNSLRNYILFAKKSKIDLLKSMHEILRQ